MRSIRSLLGCLLLLGGLVGCGLLNENSDNDENTDYSPTIQAPQVISFGAEVATAADEISVVTLTWEVSGTNPTLSISPTPGTVTGTSVTLPLGATTYILTATNSAGKSSKSVSLNDEASQPAPPDDDEGQPVSPD